MDTINKYWQEKAQYDESHKQEQVVPSPQQSPMFNHTILFKTIDDIDSMSDSELRYFINNNFLSIMNNVFNNTAGYKYVKAFQNTRFLDAFIDVISQIRYFDLDVIVRINLIAYQYITSSVKEADIARKMIKMSTIINYVQSVRLKKFNISEKLETYLLLARNSDFNLNVCVKRVDLMIITSHELMNILDIDPTQEISQDKVEWLAKLLAELYKMEEWTYVLPYYMLDVLPDNDGTPATEWITPEVESMDSALSLAVLHLLETMIDDSIMLRAILVSYAEGYRMINDRRPIRFSFRNLSDDYARIKNTISYIEEEEKIFIP